MDKSHVLHFTFSGSSFNFSAAFDSTTIAPMLFDYQCVSTQIGRISELVLFA